MYHIARFMCAPYCVVRTEPVCCEPRHRRVEALNVSLCWRWRRTFWTLLMIATRKITMLKWKRCKFDNWRWLSVLFCCECKWTKNNSVFNWKVLLLKFTKLYEVRCTHNKGDVVNLTIFACSLSSRWKWYKNYKNRLRLAKVIIKNKMSRFLWFTVYMTYWNDMLVF